MSVETGRNVSSIWNAIRRLPVPDVSYFANEVDIGKVKRTLS
jgi:hypothetical protein